MPDFRASDSKECLDAVVASADQLLRQNVVLQAMVKFKAIGHRLIHISDAVLANSLKNEWDLDESTTLSVLKFQAREIAMHTPDSAAKIEIDVLKVVLPLLRILASQERI
ncbi:MAG: hypothetical protein K8T91_01805 [Planctomycetes bacterium]|nr:hypothetical protein [Planctomycetota bacterium]